MAKLNKLSRDTPSLTRYDALINWFKNQPLGIALLLIASAVGFVGWDNLRQIAGYLILRRPAQVAPQNQASTADDGYWEIHFDFDRTTLRPDALRPLSQNVVPWLKSHPDAYVRLEGYSVEAPEGPADNAGEVLQYARAVADKRIKSVTDFLVDSGISRFRISGTAVGAERLPATADTARGRAMNRLVRIIAFTAKH